MGVIFSIIGFIILGLIVRSLLGDKSVEGSPKSGSSWVVQIVISVIVGFVVWSVIPQSCKNSSDREYDGRYYE